MMSDAATQSDRDERGRFQTGNTGGGRPRGSRNKLGEAFIEDLRDAWNELGVDALRRCAEQDPSTFCRIVSSLLPKTIDLNMSLDATSFASKLQQAAALLGHDIDPPRQIRRPLPGQRIIEHSE